jgi:hypothetical protein
MVTSGGYQKKNALTIADSIENLETKFGILSQTAKKLTSARLASNQPSDSHTHKYSELI